MRSIPGTSLLLIGSGLYWILSSRLISSFTALTPGLFQSSPFDQNLITTIGLISTAAGLWILGNDLTLFSRLAMNYNGYLFTIPIVLVNLDIYSTIFSLSLNSRAIELNPFVASAIQYGSVALVPFLISYLALSQGLALLMITTGERLFGSDSANRFLPFTMICGVSSFGPFSNMIGLAIGFGTSMNYDLGAIGSIVLAALILHSLTGITALNPPDNSKSNIWQRTAVSS